MGLNESKPLLVLPVYNEEDCLEQNVKKTLNFLAEKKLDWQVVICDNGSTDRTSVIAKKLEKEFSNLDYLRIETIGRGRAIKTAWQKYLSDVYLYMDIDLSTDLRFLPPLAEEINKGNDMVVGSRYLSESKAKRKILRGTLSKFYNRLVRLFFRMKISDFQCGFKAVNNKVVKDLLSQIRDNGWFFDTELVLLGEKRGYKIKEIPIYWQEGKTSKVKLFQTSLNYFINLIELKLRK